ncbi:glycosyltransferase family A protein [Calothrix sp. CCY 0018]|uniref:glycosyltransferase family A protein n=1 Tax=Calothrix sp. CCY 0018 TaxID=3103864 RepID=UPI0039C65F7D
MTSRVDNQYIFTVFTPTYNRADTLDGVYESLKNQTFQNFEWLIVDDGSTDNTKKRVEQWQRTNKFPIRYIWQNNKGKHIAFNRGVKEAKGELFLNLDSDNRCVPQALERFKLHWDLIGNEKRNNFSAVTALCVNTKGQLIGDKFPDDIIDSNAFEIRTKYRIFGEKWGFQKTNILKKFTFPEIADEKFVPEDLIWNRISLFYQTRFINEELGIYRELGDDSLTKSMTKVRVNSVRATIMYYKEYCQLPVPIKWKVRQTINYIRFSVHGKVKLHKIILDSGYSFLTIMLLPLGYYFYLSDKYQFSK